MLWSKARNIAVRRPIDWPPWPPFHEFGFESFHVRWISYLAGAPPVEWKWECEPDSSRPEDPTAHVVLAESISIDLRIPQRCQRLENGNVLSEYLETNNTDTGIRNIDRLLPLVDSLDAIFHLQRERDKRARQKGMTFEAKLTPKEIFQLHEYYLREDEFLRAAAESTPLAISKYNAAVEPEAPQLRDYMLSFAVKKAAKTGYESTDSDINAREDAALAAIDSMLRQLARDANWAKTAGDASAEIKARTRISELEAKRDRLLKEYATEREKLLEPDVVSQTSSGPSQRSGNRAWTRVYDRLGGRAAT